MSKKIKSPTVSNPVRVDTYEDQVMKCENWYQVAIHQFYAARYLASLTAADAKRFNQRLQDGCFEMPCGKGPVGEIPGDTGLYPNQVTTCVIYPGYLLLGYAFENLLKGLLVETKHSGATVDAATKNLTGLLRSHRLGEIGKQLASLKLKEEELKFLEYLESCTVWRARYAFPTSHGDYPVQAKTHDERHWATANDILKKVETLSAALGDSNHHSWRLIFTDWTGLVDPVLEFDFLLNPPVQMRGVEFIAERRECELPGLLTQLFPMEPGQSSHGTGRGSGQ